MMGYSEVIHVDEKRAFRTSAGANVSTPDQTPATHPDNRGGFPNRRACQLQSLP
jgi:hypothetical protein